MTLDLKGSEILGYRVVSLVGQGGMASVWLGQHPMLGRRVAIKVLDALLARDRDLVQRFLDEARIQCELRHAGIVAVENFCPDPLSMVMEFIEGRSLAQTIGHVVGPIPMASALPMMLQMLDALSYAHRHGVIHRDIKPANVIVTTDGSIKVMDFGIAKILGGSKMTRTGTGMGTAAYMSPEQIRGAKDADARSDVYSLGVTFYEMLAGRPPFETEGTEESDFQVRVAHVQQPPPDPRTFYPAIPGPVVAILMKALAKDPGQRFQSMDEMRQALEGATGAASRAITGSVPGVSGAQGRLSRPSETGTMVEEPRRMGTAAIMQAVAMCADAKKAEARGDFEAAWRTWNAASQTDPSNAEARAGVQRTESRLAEARLAQAQYELDGMVERAKAQASASDIPSIKETCSAMDRLGKQFPDLTREVDLGKECIATVILKLESALEQKGFLRASMEMIDQAQAALGSQDLLQVRHDRLAQAVRRLGMGGVLLAEGDALGHVGKWSEALETYGQASAHGASDEQLESRVFRCAIELATQDMLDGIYVRAAEHLAKLPRVLDRPDQAMSEAAARCLAAIAAAADHSLAKGTVETLRIIAEILESAGGLPGADAAAVPTRQIRVSQRIAQIRRNKFIVRGSVVLAVLMLVTVALVMQARAKQREEEGQRQHEAVLAKQRIYDRQWDLGMEEYSARRARYTSVTGEINQRGAQAFSALSEDDQYLVWVGKPAAEWRCERAFARLAQAERDKLGSCAVASDDAAYQARVRELGMPALSENERRFVAGVDDGSISPNDSMAKPIVARREREGKSRLDPVVQRYREVVEQMASARDWPDSQQREAERVRQLGLDRLTDDERGFRDAMQVIADPVAYCWEVGWTLLSEEERKSIGNVPYAQFMQQHPDLPKNPATGVLPTP